MPEPCRICGSPSEGKFGLCHTHRERWRRWGRPDVEAWIEAFLAGRLSMCVVCGVGFNGYLGRSTCGPECDRKRRAAISLRRYNAKTPETRRRDADAKLAREKARRTARLKPKTCPNCKETFMPRSLRDVCQKPECCRLRALLASRKSHHIERHATVLKTIQERINEPD